MSKEKDLRGLLFSGMSKDGDSVAGLNCEECLIGKEYN